MLMRNENRVPEGMDPTEIAAVTAVGFVHQPLTTARRARSQKIRCSGNQSREYATVIYLHIVQLNIIFFIQKHFAIFSF